MKLSNRKQLLKEADDVLKEISEQVLTEFDFEFNKNRIKDVSRETTFDFINWKLKKELGLIEKKYRYKNDPVSRQKERDELIEFVKKLRKHIVDNNVEIPEDPDKQSEIQKLIVNAPPFPQGFDYYNNYAKTLLKDKETGMYWSLRTGLPAVPPAWQKDALEYELDITSSVQYDYSRGWFYNFLRRLLFASSGD